MTSAAARPPRRPRSAENTEAAFLDAAELLFGERGYDATSIRAIAEHAGANLGALHYYWGSKEALLQATCERRLRPVAEERLRRFDACLMRAAGGVPDLREVLEAFLVPALLHEDESERERHLVGRLLACLGSSAAPEVRRIRASIIDETSFRFVRLLRQACPQLDDESFYWRLHAVFGTLQYAMGGGERIRTLSHGRFAGNDQARGIEEFLVGLCQLLGAAPLAGTAPKTPVSRARRGSGSSTSRTRKVRDE
ncbi:MAG TPA: TetR/AcrR family transcriptional regulator [Burkholderiaceae bacterium]|nr:TetR/AcrR family transcriptional regulator [Burkholderiaceae bacterium]